VAATGYNTIDIEAAHSKGNSVANVSGYAVFCCRAYHVLYTVAAGNLINITKQPDGTGATHQSLHGKVAYYVHFARSWALWHGDIGKFCPVSPVFGSGL
jgi:hypothetical protein